MQFAPDAPTQHLRIAKNHSSTRIKKSVNLHQSVALLFPFMLDAGIGEMCRTMTVWLRGFSFHLFHHLKFPRNALPDALVQDTTLLGSNSAFGGSPWSFRQASFETSRRAFGRCLQRRCQYNIRAFRRWCPRWRL